MVRTKDCRMVTLLVVVVLLLSLVVSPPLVKPVKADPGWYIETVDSIGGVGTWCSIALDGNNYPHISYYDETNDDLKYARWNGTAWNTQTVDSAGDVGASTSIALDVNGYPHISYGDNTNEDLKYATWDGTAWNTQTVDSAGSVGWWTSIALDGNNYPHISYGDNTNEDLKYANWDGTAWNRQTVDSAGSVGFCNSIALDGNNYPHISYGDNTNEDLKYATWDGTAWNTQTVDSAGSVGWWTSIALDGNNYPHISYGDNTNEDLKYARFIPPPTVTSVNPNQGKQGETLAVTIKGTYFVGATAVNFGAGITVNNFTVASETQIAASITIAAGAAPGTRDVSVTTPEGTGTLAGRFTVNQAAPAPARRRASPSAPSVPPAIMTLQYLAVNPQQQYAGEPVTIITNVSNTGGCTGSYTVVLMINGQVEETRLVSVGAQSAMPVKFIVTRDVPGTYTVTIGGQQASFTIVGASTAGSPINGGLIAIIIMGVLVLATVVGLMLVLRRPASQADM